MPVEIAVDPCTGDIRVGPDGPEMTDDLTTSLYLAIAVERGRFHGDPELGSDFAAMVRGAAAGQPSIALEQAARRALQPFVDAGELVIDGISVSGTRVTIESRQLASPLEVGVE